MLATTALSIPITPAAEIVGSPHWTVKKRKLKSLVPQKTI